MPLPYSPTVSGTIFHTTNGTNAVRFRFRAAAAYARFAAGTARILPALLFFFLIGLQDLQAQKLQSLEFRNQDIADILASLAKVSGRSIIPDSTVTGKATYYFSETDFEQAFRAFLYNFRLHAVLRNGIQYVSRIRAENGTIPGTLDIDAEDVDVTLLVRAVSLAAEKTVLYDPLPKRELTVHLRAVTLRIALETFVYQMPEFTVEETEKFFYLRNTTPVKQSDTAARRKQEYFSIGVEGRYAVSAKQARLSDVLDDLFAKAGLEYSLFLRPELTIDALNFSDKSFEEMLRLVLDQAGGDCTVENGVYYVYEVQKRDLLKRLKTTEFIRLTYLNAQDLPNLFPQEMASSGFFRLDKAANGVILTGSPGEIEPIREFILKADRPNDGVRYERFDVKHRKAKDVIPLVTAKYPGLQPQLIPETNSFTVTATDAARKELRGYLETVDVAEPSYPVRLRYVNSKTLLESLPPSIDRSNIVTTQDENLVFFVGSDEKRERFLSELELLDRPEPQIRYELLVVQYRKSSRLNWGIEVSGKPAASGENAVLGTMGNLLSLNFDIVSSFGYLFAVKLNTSLAENGARILADTTLNGLSGQEIKFQNTNTYRYRDFEIDPDTGKQKSTGITREITSGLIINVKGWVSGEGMITMHVSSVVSKRGVDGSTQNGNPPPTSEKTVTTDVRTLSGTPVVIGGLFQQEVDTILQKVPVLGDIPLLGLLFQSKTDSVEDTELVIYIVPHLEFPETAGMSVSDRLDELYGRFVDRREP